MALYGLDTSFNSGSGDDPGGDRSPDLHCKNQHRAAKNGEIKGRPCCLPIGSPALVLALLGLAMNIY